MFRALLSIFTFSVSYLLVPISISAQDIFLPDPDQETPLDAESVTAIFSGQTHRGTYNFERESFEGYSFEEVTKANGEVIHIMPSRTDTGRWEQKDNQICYSYDSDDLLPACFEFYQRGNCIYHHQQTVEGYYAPRFTAVSVIKGETPDCEPPMV